MFGMGLSQPTGMPSLMGGVTQPFGSPPGPPSRFSDQLIGLDQNGFFNSPPFFDALFFTEQTEEVKVVKGFVASALIIAKQKG
jgi:hypothetical protein